VRYSSLAGVAREGFRVLVQWEKRLEIGVPEIDAQHRELFARVQGFDVALAKGDHVQIARTFAFLREYALVHFAAEEKLMRESSYSRLDVQREQHAKFTERLAELSREHEKNGASFLFRKRAENWILLWLVEHVGTEDARLGFHLLTRSA
jgi:hemerythrin